MAVADVNYGGSTGFGKAYRQRLTKPEPSWVRQTRIFRTIYFVLGLPAPVNIYVTPLRFKLGGRPILSAHYERRIAGFERQRPEILNVGVSRNRFCDFLADPDSRSFSRFGAIIMQFTVSFAMPFCPRPINDDCTKTGSG